MEFRPQLRSDSLPRHVIRQAEALVARGAVIGLEVGDRGDVRATVRERGDEYRVHLFRGPDPRTGAPHRCSCHEQYLCRHVGAVHLALENPDAHASADVCTRLANSRIRSWLDAIAAPTVPAPARSPSDVLYVLRPARGDAIVEVEAMQARRKKDGSGYGRATVLSTKNVLRGNGAGCVTRADERLIQRLALIGRSGYANDYALGRGAGLLLLELVRTGRCFALDTNRDPLRESDARAATPAWRLDDSGRQAPSVDVEGGGQALLFDDPLWLGDDAVGPLTVSTDVRALREFGRGPTLPATTAAALAPDVRRQFESLRLPAPHRLEIVTTESTELQRGLICYTARFPSPYLETVTIDAVHPFVRYGEHTVPLADPEEWLVVRDGHRVEHTRRDLAREAVLLETLTGLGFVNVLETLEPGLHDDVATELMRAGAVLDMTLDRDCDTVDERAWQHFIERVVPELRANGWDITFDDRFRFGYVRAHRMTASVRSSTGLDWFDVELGVEVGDDGERIDISPILQRLLSEAATSNAEDIRAEVDGRTVLIPARRLRRIARSLIEFTTSEPTAATGRVRLLDRQVATLAELEEHVDAFEWGEAEPVRDLSRRLANFDGVEPVPKPPNCKARMRKYQREGLAWLQFLRQYELNGILADDMGLGKTIQVLAHLLAEKAAGRADRPSLVFAPTSVASNWVAEARRFAPSLEVLLLHGPDRARHHGSIPDADLVVTTYALALRDADVLEQHDYHLLVLDEAQAIKNARSRVRQALRKLEARHRLCLTGTPMENNLTELWSQLDFLMPGLLGDARSFGRTFRTPIERNDDEAARTALLRRIRPFVLRRTKEQVLRQLPSKTEVVRTVRLGRAQRDLYESIRVAMHERVQQAIDDAGINRAQIVILDALLKLRQVCCDPGLVKLAAARKVTQSAKLDELMELLPTLLADGRRVLLFSQFTTMLARIETRLEAAKIPYAKLTGSTKDRTTPIERFQSGEVPVFLISLKAGGFGLNLTAADAVIHYDPWWNPAAERQATDRAHRIGQDKPVFVYRLIVTDSVEEKITQLQQRKRALFDGIVDAGGTSRTSGARLTREDVEWLIGGAPGGEGSRGEASGGEG